MSDPMSFAKEIEELFDSKPYKPSEALQAARERLNDAFDESTGSYSPWLEDMETDKSAWPGVYGYYAAVNKLEQGFLFAASESLLLSWWNDWGQRQLDKHKQVYFAGIAFKLTEHYFRLGDMGAAFRWALHTQAADILGKHAEEGGAAKQQLPTFFGVSETNLERLNNIAKDCLKEIEDKHHGDWSQAEGFPEEVICRFAQNLSTSHAMTNAVSIREFPLSTAYFQALLTRATASYPTGEEGKKGDALENLAAYLSLLLPGCLPLRKVVDEAGVSEHDIVVHNLYHTPTLVAELLGHHFLIECKNWDTRKVGPQEVGYFLYRIKLAHAHFGIMFVMKGISKGDDKQSRNAKELIRRAFHEDDTICLVIDGEDLKRLGNGEVSFWWMLVEKIESLRFGKSKIS